MAEEPCVIGEAVTIRGNVSGTEDLVVRGRVEGALNLGSHLEIAPGGVVEADVEAEDVTVEGSLAGKVTAAGRVAIGAEAAVAGDVRASRLVIEEGARMKGRVEMDVPLPPGLEG